jgi:hypothetical protein
MMTEDMPRTEIRSRLDGSFDWAIYWHDPVLPIDRGIEASRAAAERASSIALTNWAVDKRARRVDESG